MTTQIIALSILCILLFVAIFRYSKDAYNHEPLGESFEDVNNEPVYNKVEKPTLPTPTLHDLNIDKSSKLAKVYEMLVSGDILNDEICARVIGSKRVSIFIFRLREKGIVIDTLIMPDGKCAYAYRGFKI